VIVDPLPTLFKAFRVRRLCGFWAQFTVSLRSASYSAAFRIGGLCSRFLLTLYIVHYVGFRAMGYYGFLNGGCAAIVTLSGLGLDYRITRQTINGNGSDVALIVRDRLILRLIVALAITLVGATVALAAKVALLDLLFSSYIIVCESVNYELQQCLISRRRPVAGNFLLFIRSAFWVPVVIVIGLVLPSTRTMTTILAGWSCGLAVSLAVAIFFLLRRKVLERLVTQPIPWVGLWYSAKSAPITYLSELGTFCQIYVDRFIIAIILGVDASGKYVFFWSMTNAIVPITQASIFNPLLPHLVTLWAEKRVTSWHLAITRGGNRVLALGSASSLIIIVASIAIGRHRGHIENQGIELLVLLSIGTVIRLRADLVHIALYSTESDSDWIAVNLIALLISPLLSAVFLASFGLLGAGLQMIVTALILWWMRGKLLRLAIRSENAL
jgi:O-antigen/teichoic acid export membrane protein